MGRAASGGDENGAGQDLNGSEDEPEELWRGREEVDDLLRGDVWASGEGCEECRRLGELRGAVVPSAVLAAHGPRGGGAAPWCLRCSEGRAWRRRNRSDQIPNKAAKI